MEFVLVNLIVENVTDGNTVNIAQMLIEMKKKTVTQISRKFLIAEYIKKKISVEKK